MSRRRVEAFGLVGFPGRCDRVLQLAILRGHAGAKGLHGIRLGCTLGFQHLAQAPDRGLQLLHLRAVGGGQLCEALFTLEPEFLQCVAQRQHLAAHAKLGEITVVAEGFHARAGGGIPGVARTQYLRTRTQASRWRAKVRDRTIRLPRRSPSMDLKVPPMLLAAVLALLAWALDLWVPGPRLRDLPGQGILAAILAGAGLGILMAGALALGLARTTLDPLHPERAARLVASGVYRFTRNPIYLGALGVLAGFVLYLGQPLGLGLLPFWVWYITRFQIRPEETAMHERFGAAWIVYSTRVRRWI